MHHQVIGAVACFLTLAVLLHGWGVRLWIAYTVGIAGLMGTVLYGITYGDRELDPAGAHSSIYVEQVAKERGFIPARPHQDPKLGVDAFSP